MIIHFLDNGKIKLNNEVIDEKNTDIIMNEIKKELADKVKKD
ncbi:MAG: hypothetical protein WC002_00745 [Candidatus Muiribacteriota bacterium]|jgi:predicted SprT family Zn-dependent metalloprotease